MKILVTGAAGFIGSHLCETLAFKGHEVTGIDSLSNFLYPRERKVLNCKDFASLGIQFFEMDMTIDDLEKVVYGKDVVINQAATPGLVKSWSHLETYSSSNILAVGRLLEAIRKSNVQRLVQISTSSVYGKNATNDETSSTLPYSPYGVTKLAAENLVRAYRENLGIPSTILRYYSVYGPRQRPDMAYYKFIDAISKNKVIDVYGDGTQTRTNTFVRDIVQGTLSAMDLDKRVDGEIFNLSGENSVSMLEVIKLIESQLNKEAKLNFLPSRIGDQYVTKGVITKARELLGYSPQTNILLGLKEQINWQAQSAQN